MEPTNLVLTNEELTWLRKLQQHYPWAGYVGSARFKMLLMRAGEALHKFDNQLANYTVVHQMYAALRRETYDAMSGLLQASEIEIFVRELSTRVSFSTANQENLNLYELVQRSK